MTFRAEHNGEPQLPRDPSIAVFSLESGQRLTEQICQRLGIGPAHHEEREFEDGEHKIRPLRSVRGQDVYVVQSLYGDADLSVNDKLVRVLAFLGALGDAGARRVTAVTPYLCYARKDRRTKPRDPVTFRYVASMFEAVGVDRIVTVDVHNPAAYDNAFEIPAERLTAAPTFAEHFAERLEGRDGVVVSPDAGGAKRAERFRQLLTRKLDRPVDSAFIEKYRSGGNVTGGTVVGAVEDRVAVIVDDLVSSGGTLARAAAACKQQGAREVHAVATHGVFAPAAGRTLRDSELDSIVLFDTIPPRRLDVDLPSERIQILESADLLASAIHRLHTDGSLVQLGAHRG